MWQIDWDIPLAEYCRRYTHGRNERERDMTNIIIFALGMFTGATTLAVLSCLAMGDDDETMLNQ